MSRSRMPVVARLALAGAAALAVVGSSLTPASGAPAAAVDPPTYVALGDSYSAGSFVRPWDDSDGCGRSYRNYPHQVAERLGYELTDVTCGAAEVVEGILEPQPSEKVLGPPTTPPPGGWDAKAPQIDALSHDTDYVTVSIGGNSLGFGPILTKCLELGAFAPVWKPTPCTDYYTDGGGGADWLDGQFARLDADFDRMMTQIRAAAPHAKIAVVGYQAVVADPSGCRYGHWNQLGSIRKGDMPWVDELERDLNGLLKKQADNHGTAYVDTYGTSTGHGVCESGDAKWMYGIKDNLTGDGDQTDPPAGPCRQIPGTGESCTLVHPNARGLDNQAREVTEALRVPSSRS
ncbi:SGNH/GDSL hydrolase family protein [Streptomyces sp. NPDC058989]|uniref:SGNH/GDSL hydrolase family protein n=1 Tax=Streptomyces sp. NPDC058989 TaxID=3346686 RepID=UPI0036C6C2FF